MQIKFAILSCGGAHKTCYLSYIKTKVSKKVGSKGNNRLPKIQSLAFATSFLLQKHSSLRMKSFLLKILSQVIVDLSRDSADVQPHK